MKADVLGSSLVKAILVASLVLPLFFSAQENERESSLLPTANATNQRVPIIADGQHAAMSPLIPPSEQQPQ